MRILQIHNRYRLAGGEDAVADTEAELLAGGGHEVHRLLATNPSSTRRAARAMAAAPWNRASGRALRTLLAKVQPDLAHVHNTWFVLSPAIFSTLADAGIPTLLTLHNYRLLCANAQLFRDGHFCTDCVGTTPWPGVRHTCYRGSLSSSAVAAATISLSRQIHTWDCVDRFLATSDFVRRLFVQAGFDPRRIDVKPNVVADPGARLHPPSASSTVLYVGRLAPEKGIDDLLQAWRRASLPDAFRLEVVGDGPSRARLERSRPLRTHFAGWLGHGALTTRMLTARALVFPSKWPEGFPLVLVEALAAGLPVIASDLGSPGVLAGELGTDFAVPPNDISAWVEALRRLTTDHVVDAASARARHIYQRKYTPAIGLRTLNTVYASVIAGGALNSQGQPRAPSSGGAPL